MKLRTKIIVLLIMFVAAFFLGEVVLNKEHRANTSENTSFNNNKVVTSEVISSTISSSTQRTSSRTSSIVTAQTKSYVKNTQNIKSSIETSKNKETSVCTIPVNPKTDGGKKRYPKNSLIYKGKIIRFSPTGNKFSFLSKASTPAKLQDRCDAVLKKINSGLIVECGSRFSPHDNRSTYFLGHNPGAAKPLSKMKKGDILSVSDHNSILWNYKITDIATMKANVDNTWDIIFNTVNLSPPAMFYYNYNIECLVFQTCIGGGLIRYWLATPCF